MDEQRYVYHLYIHPIETISTHMICNLVNNKCFMVLSLLITIIIQAKAQGDTSSYTYTKPLFDFEYIKPVFKLNEEQALNKNGFLRFSVLTGYREGVNPVPGFANFNGYTDTLTMTRRIYMFNLSIEEMVTHGQIDPSYVILEVKNPSKYRYDSRYGNKNEWLRKNGYCFELMLPQQSASLEVLNNELSRLLKIKFGFEKRSVNTLVLTRTSENEKFKSLGLGASQYDQNGTFNNLPLSTLSEVFYKAGLPLFINETGYVFPVDLKLKINSWHDLPSLRKELKKYDLALNEEVRQLDMFIIKETN